MKIVVSAAEVAQNLAEYLIIDARSREEFDASHIMGAVHLPGNPHLKNDNVVISQKEFADVMSKIGADASSKILVYDDGNGRSPARFWVVAHHYGHRNVHILDGGWPAAALPKSNTPRDIAPTSYTADSADGYITTTGQILDNFDKIKLLDVRTLDEYEGRNLVDNPRGGHIQGAINIDFTRLMMPDDNEYFIPHDDIHAIMAAAGISKEDALVCY